MRCPAAAFCRSLLPSLAAVRAQQSDNYLWFDCNEQLVQMSSANLERRVVFSEEKGGIGFLGSTESISEAVKLKISDPALGPIGRAHVDHMRKPH